MKTKLWVCIIFLTFNLHASNVRFNNINAMYGISMRETASACSDDNGFIWVSSKTGILRLTDNDYRIYQLPYQTTDIIFVRLVYKKPVLFAYTNNGQVFRYNTIYDRFDFLFDFRKPLNTIHLFISNILVEDLETFWFASNLGLYKYRADELTLVNNDSATVSQAIRYDDRRLLFTNDKGLWMIDAGTLKCNCIYDNTSSLPFQIQKLYYDASAEKLWLGTLSSGLYRYDFNTHTFSIVTISSFPKQPVLAIEANSDSTLLFGIDGQGVWEIDKNTDAVLNIYKENEDDPLSLRGDGVYDLFCDWNKRIWVCTYSGGVSFFDQVSSPILQITHQANNSNSLSNNYINKIIEDSRANIWFATNNGISCWNLKTNQWKTFYHNKQEQAKVFLSLCEDNEGRIWAGTYASGIYVLDGATGKELAHYSGQTSGFMIDNFVFDIFKDSKGDLWLGGVSGEIIHYHVKENRFQTYPSQPVYSFAELPDNHILMACTYGLVLLDSETAASNQLLSGYLVHDLLVLDGNVWIATSGNGLIYLNMENQTTKIFTTESGLPSNYINSIAYAGGYLWLGTENGLCRFDPQKKTIQTYPSIFPLTRVSYNLNAHCLLKNGQLIWGTSNGAVLFDPSGIHQLQPRGKIFLQDLFIAGRSIRDSATFRLNTPLDSLKTLKLKYYQKSLTLELIPISEISNTKFSWTMEGLDKEWNLPSNLRVVTYTNLPSGNFRLKIRLYDDSLLHVLDERSIDIEVVPLFWQTGWFLLLVSIFIFVFVYFFQKSYFIRLRQRHTEEKLRFFTKTAHDVRTSLTLIKAPIEELNKEQNLTDFGRHYLHLAMEQIKHLSKVATQLLDFQKMDIGKEQITFNMADIVKLITHRILMFESFAKSKDIELIFESNQAIYMTAVDESKMEKVVDNLISNAVKYSYPNSRVYITINCREKAWELEVKDSGIGISRKAQRRLFREFYRSENAVNYKIIGSGIGLMLVKNYVVMHRGQVNCVSKENEGSTFRVAIPFKELEKQKNTVAIQNEQPAHVTVTDMKMTLQPLNDIQKSDIHILIVEDNDDLRNFMLYPLRNEFEVSTAADGIAAWDMICMQMPDLIVSDVMMPNMDGFELCRLIKSTFETSHIPVILLTALSDKAEQLHGLGLGADDYLTKPFDMGILLQRIRSIIKNREIVREKTMKMINFDNDNPILSNELNDSFVKKAMEIVNSQISNSKFGKDEFAAAMNISASLLYKKIKTFTDQSPVDFIKTLRLNHAMKLLQTRKHTVTEVSELCGFASIGYFSMVFRKHFGKSPSEIF